MWHACTVCCGWSESRKLVGYTGTGMRNGKVGRQERKHECARMYYSSSAWEEDTPVMRAVVCCVGAPCGSGEEGGNGKLSSRTIDGMW